MFRRIEFLVYISERNGRLSSLVGAELCSIRSYYGRPLDRDFETATMSQNRNTRYGRDNYSHRSWPYRITMGNCQTHSPITAPHR